MSTSPASKVRRRSAARLPVRFEGVLKSWSVVASHVAFVSAVGVTNQRETTLVWDKETGEPLYRAIGELERRSVTWKVLVLSFLLSSGAAVTCLLSPVDEYDCCWCPGKRPRPSLSAPQLSHALPFAAKLRDDPFGVACASGNLWTADRCCNLTVFKLLK